jgi:hypothetical protein
MKTPLSLLTQHHRRAVWLRPLWILAAGLSLELPLTLLEVPLDFRLKLLGATAVFALLARFWRAPTLRDTAREIDAAAGFNNRLEALVEVGDRCDAFADATREEIGSHLQRHRAPRPYLWIAASILLAVLLPVNAVLFLTAKALVAPPPRVAVVTPETPPAVEPEAPPLPPAAGPPPPAILRWISPEVITKAGPKEEILTSAETESITGLRNLQLHLALNGEERAPLPISSALEPGVKPVVASLLLEPFEGRPYDIVSYYLVADRVRPPNVAPEPIWPPVYSPLQFVIVRPPRDEPMTDPEPEDPAGAVLRTLRQLKDEQLNLARDAFALSHGLPDRDDPQWPELARAAAARQSASLRQTEAVLPLLATHHIPAEVADRLKEAMTAMQASATELARSEPEPATAPATRALSRLTAAEDITARFLWENRLRAAAVIADQAAPKNSDLPDRADTPADRLEKLSARQTAIADQLATHQAADGIFSEQDTVARAVAKLAGENAFPSEINGLIQNAGKSATESATQLNERDLEAAREPAAWAAQLLRDAIDALEAASRRRAEEQLQFAQQSFNSTATELSRPRARPTRASTSSKPICAPPPNANKRSGPPRPPGSSTKWPKRSVSLPCRPISSRCNAPTPRATPRNEASSGTPPPRACVNSPSRPLALPTARIPTAHRSTKPSPICATRRRILIVSPAVIPRRSSRCAG